jgi:RNA polymerase sigma-70 factor (TIGR02943 family)
MQYHISTDLDWPPSKNRPAGGCAIFLHNLYASKYIRDMSSQPGGVGGDMMNEAIERAASAVAGNDPATWVDEHGDVLYRYALARVRKPDVAQDLVQETFLAAMRGHEKFAGQSSVRSWLCGILKHKLCDYYRKLGRETSFTDLEFLDDECAEKFVPEGYWVHMNGPKEWKPEVDEVMHRDEFWQTMRDCLAKLPERIATVFMMREMDEIESKEICVTLSISDSNLWVMLHRARMALRDCLAANWFENPEVQH